MLSFFFLNNRTDKMKKKMKRCETR